MRSIPSFLLVVITLSTLFVCVKPSRGEELSLVTVDTIQGSFDYRLLSFDTETGQGRSLGPVGIGNSTLNPASIRTTGLAFDYATNTLYGTRSGIGVSGAVHDLITIDPTTLESTLIGGVIDDDTQYSIRSLAYDSTRDELVGLGTSLLSQTLSILRIDPSDGRVLSSSIAPNLTSGSSFGDFIAYDATRDALLLAQNRHYLDDEIINRFRTRLVTIFPDGITSSVLVGTDPGRGLTAIDTDPISGDVFGFQNFDFRDPLALFDTATDDLSIIGPLFVDGSEFDANTVFGDSVLIPTRLLVPEPSAVALALLATLGCYLRRNR